MYLFSSEEGDNFKLYNAIFNIIATFGIGLMIVSDIKFLDLKSPKFMSFIKRNWQCLPIAGFFFILSVIFTLNEFYKDKYNTWKPIYYIFELTYWIYIISIIYVVIKYFKTKYFRK